MAIGDDFSVAVNGDIRHTTNTNNWTVLALHRWLQDLADDEATANNELVDITSDTPSERSTDNIITLNGTYNIDNDAAEYLYAGSITQTSGDTVYSGLQVLGAVNNSDTQLHIIQNNQLYPFTTDDTAPFWGDQSSGGYNGVPASGILMQVMIKSRDNGADIDGKRIRVQARSWGDTYDFFNVTLGQGVSVAAIGTTPDAQNTTPVGAVTTYTHVVDSGGTANAPVGGYQTIDLGNGNGAQPYYSKWTYGANTSGDLLKGIWEYIKELSGHGSPITTGLDETALTSFTGGSSYNVADVITMSDGSTVTVDVGTGAITEFTINSTTGDSSLKAGDVLTQVSATPATGTGFTITVLTANLVAQKTINALDGQLFLGITHSSATAAPSAAFAEQGIIAWGTAFAYDGGTTTSAATRGDRVVFSGGAGGEITFIEDTVANTSGTIYCMLDSGETAPADPETFIVYNDAGSNIANAVINGAVGAEGGGGTALLLADDTGGDVLYYQLLTGVAPGTSKTIVGNVPATTAVTSGTAVAKTIPKTFLGSYTGSLIGAYGIGLLDANLLATDTVEDLLGATQTPPNNVTFTVTGLVFDDANNNDRVLVGPRAAGILQKDQFDVTGNALVSGNTTIEINVAIPTDTPAAGNIRVENNANVYLQTPYASYTGNVFTLTGTYGDTAALTNNVFISYIDANVVTATTSLEFTSVFLSTRDLFIRVRDGGATPIKTFEAPSQLTSSGGTIAAIRTTDL